MSVQCNFVPCQPIPAPMAQGQSFWPKQQVVDSNHAIPMHEIHLSLIEMSVSIACSVKQEGAMWKGVVLYVSYPCNLCCDTQILFKVGGRCITFNLEVLKLCFTNTNCFYSKFVMLCNTNVLKTQWSPAGLFQCL